MQMFGKVFMKGVLGMGNYGTDAKNDEIYPAYQTITAVKDQDGIITHYVSTQTDITLRKFAEAEIERLAFYDPLTSLPNRRLFQDRLHLAQALSHRNGKQGALLFIDLDNFKNSTIPLAMTSAIYCCKKLPRG